VAASTTRGAAPRKAVALRYQQGGEPAPRVVAKGSGDLAERILRMARENAVPIHEDRDLVSLLSKLDVDAFVPPALYRAIAEVLVFVYRASAKKR
jgi:flagellar biosynthesis protein